MKKSTLIIFTIVIFFISITAPRNAAHSENSIDSLFSVSISKGLVKTQYKYTVSDISPEWPKILFAGLSLAAIYADSGDTIEVEIKEQDFRIHVYSINVNDYFDFLNDRIMFIDFLRKIYKKVR